MIDAIKADQGSSTRRCCAVLGFARSTYLRQEVRDQRAAADAALRELLRQTCSKFLAWGFWMVFHYLRNQGLTQANHKRVYRLYKAEELHLRAEPKRQRLHRTYQDLLAPDHINEGWAMDFVSDWLVGPSQKAVRVINIVDEHSRRALWTEAHASIPASKLTEILDHLVEVRGAPCYIRTDNGPEFISKELQRWASDHGVTLRFIQPGKPSQNGICERLNKTLRKECLNLTWFTTMSALNDSIQEWSQTYNLVRPHESLGYKSPNDYETEHANLYYRMVPA